MLESDSNLYIKGNTGGNKIIIDNSGSTGFIELICNTINIGSTSAAGVPVNGFKTKLNFLESTGYVTQSSAFTETLKQKITNLDNSIYILQEPILQIH